MKTELWKGRLMHVSTLTSWVASEIPLHLGSA